MKSRTLIEDPVVFCGDALPDSFLALPVNEYGLLMSEPAQKNNGDEIFSE